MVCILLTRFSLLIPTLLLNLFSIYHIVVFETTAIFDRLRHVLHESETDKRVQYMIEVMFAVRKDGFKDHPVIPDGLDLVEEEDQFTHMLPLEDDYNPDDILSKRGAETELFRLDSSKRGFFYFKGLTNFLFFSPEDVFKLDPDFMENEEKYKELKKGLRPKLFGFCFVLFLVVLQCYSIIKTCFWDSAWE